MYYNEYADIFTVSQQDDGMGGFNEQMIKIATIKCKVAPYTVNIINSAGLPISYSMNKLFTQDRNFNIYSSYFIMYQGVKYKKISVMDAYKCLIIGMERVPNEN